MLLQVEGRLDTLLKGLQIEEAKVAKCAVESKKFTFQA
jgi:hypothetical protein